MAVPHCDVSGSSNFRRPSWTWPRFRKIPAVASRWSSPTSPRCRDRRVELKWIGKNTINVENPVSDWKIIFYPVLLGKSLLNMIEMETKSGVNCLYMKIETRNYLSELRGLHGPIEWSTVFWKQEPAKKLQRFPPYYPNSGKMILSQHPQTSECGKKQTSQYPTIWGSF